MVPHHAEGLQFVEAHIGSGDRLDGRVQHDALHNLLAFLLVGQPVENGKHVGELGDVGIHLPVFNGVQVSLLLVAPERLLDLVAQFFAFYAVVSLDVQQLGARGHRLQCLHEQYLLEAERSALVHGEVHPVNENPVVGLSFGHSLVVGTTEHVVHHGHHAGPHLADEIHIRRVLVVVEDGLEPVEGVVHDGVDVSRHGILAAQLADGALDTLGVKAQVVVHEVRLYGVARPRPAVTLDAVHEELAGGEVHGVGTNLPYLVQFVVRTAERAAVAEVVWCIFVIHQHVSVGGAFFLFYINVAEGLALEVSGGRGEHVERFTMVFVQRLFAALTIIDADGSL